MLSWDYPPQKTSGLAAHVAGLSAALGAAGHEVVVLTIADRRADLETEAVGNVRVRRANVALPWLPADTPLARTASANHAFTVLGATIDDAAGERLLNATARLMVADDTYREWWKKKTASR